MSLQARTPSSPQIEDPLQRLLGRSVSTGAAGQELAAERLAGQLSEALFAARLAAGALARPLGLATRREFVSLITRELERAGEMALVLRRLPSVAETACRADRSLSVDLLLALRARLDAHATSWRVVRETKGRVALGEHAVGSILDGTILALDALREPGYAPRIALRKGTRALDMSIRLHLGAGARRALAAMLAREIDPPPTSLPYESRAWLLLLAARQIEACGGRIGWSETLLGQTRVVLGFPREREACRGRRSAEA